MLTDIKEWEIMYCIISDHSGIKLQKIAKEATKATQTLWRTNNALLNELGHGYNQRRNSKILESNVNESTFFQHL